MQSVARTCMYVLLQAAFKPIGSMYAVYDNIYHQYTPNVCIYTIHGSYGNVSGSKLWCAVYCHITLLCGSRVPRCEILNHRSDSNKLLNHLIFADRPIEPTSCNRTDHTKTWLRRLSGVLPVRFFPEVSRPSINLHQLDKIYSWSLCANRVLRYPMVYHHLTY